MTVNSHLTFEIGGSWSQILMYLFQDAVNFNLVSLHALRKDAERRSINTTTLMIHIDHNIVSKIEKLKYTKI